MYRKFLKQLLSMTQLPPTKVGFPSETSSGSPTGNLISSDRLSCPTNTEGGPTGVVAEDLVISLGEKCTLNLEEDGEKENGGMDALDRIKIQWESEQVQLKQLVCLEDTEPWETKHQVYSQEQSGDPNVLKYIGGTDISFVKGDMTNACAAIVIVKLPELEVVYEDVSMVELTSPYVPGFLAFREAEFLLKKFEKLRTENPDLMPQAIIVDGNGILHPREFGLACHIGVHLGLPTVGAAKTLIHVDGIEKNEEHQNKIKTLLKEGGDRFPLVSQSGRTLGVTLRSCEKSRNPIYVSPGHNISLETAVWLVQLCCKYRIPEPVRQADIKSRQYIRENWTSPVVSDTYEH